MKVHRIKSFSLAWTLAIIFLAQCSEEDREQAFTYLPKEKSEMQVQGEKLAQLSSDATEYVFWEFENAVAVNVIEGEEIAGHHKVRLSQASSMAELYDLLSDGKGDNHVKQAIQKAENRVSRFKRDYSAAIPEKAGLSPQERTAISYSCSIGSAINGASFSHKWTNQDYDWSNCNVNKENAIAVGSMLSEIVVSIRPQDNAVLTVNEYTGTVSSGGEIVNYEVYPGYYFTWYFNYGSPLLYMDARGYSNPGASCPRVHLCLVGNE